MLLSANYGKNKIDFEIPKGKEVDIISYGGYSEGRGVEKIKEALRGPIGTSRLWELAVGKKNAVILISDMSRLAPSSMFLHYLIEELKNGGMTEEQILIVVALGMHRKQTKEELRQLVGEEVYRRVRVINHSPLPEDCFYVGTTKLGTPIEIFRPVAEADLLIATGNMEPHRLAGISGGVKALVPGVASQKTIEHNHSLSRQWKARLGDPDNPLRKDMEEALEWVPVHFLFNTIVNHQHDVVEAIAGDVRSAHQRLAEKVKERFLVPVQTKYDTVIASAGGYPKDMQLYQAVKTLQNASELAKPGGQILLLAECNEMFGNGIFQYWVETVQDQAKIERMMKEQFVLGAHKIGHIAKVLENQQVYFYSEMTPSLVELVGFQPVLDLQSTIEEITKDGTIAFMPFGSLTFPCLSEEGNETVDNSRR